MNFLGGQGYLTDEQRKRKLEHDTNHTSFRTNIDLSSGIWFSTITELRYEQLMQDIAEFICWWTVNVLPSLNGFSGFRNIEFYNNGEPFTLKI